jgi:hypothetical protein
MVKVTSCLPNGIGHTVSVLTDPLDVAEFCDFVNGLGARWRLQHQVRGSDYSISVRCGDEIAAVLWLQDVHLLCMRRKGDLYISYVILSDEERARFLECCHVFDDQER